VRGSAHRAVTTAARAGLRIRVGEVTTTASGGKCSVRVDDQTLRLHVLRGYTPTVGDEALVAVRGANGYVFGALGTAPPAPAPARDASDKPPPPEDPVYGADVFKPRQTGSYRGGSWRGDTRDLYQGDWTGRGVNQGAAFYGNGPRGLRGATVRRVRVTLKRNSGGSYGAVRPTLRLIAEKARAGAPNYIDNTLGPLLKIGERQTFTLPDSWGAQLIAGTAGGVGIYVAGASPYVALEGSAMSLRIEWKK